MATLPKLVRSLFLTAAMFIIFAKAFCFAAEEITLTAVMPGLEYAVYEDRKGPDDKGGASETGWQTRELNTEVAHQGSSISMSDNTITLQPGTYNVIASAPAYQVSYHRIRFISTPGGEKELRGTNAKTMEYTTENPVGALEHYHEQRVTTRSFIDGVITITEAKNFILEHYCRFVIWSEEEGLGEDAPYAADDPNAEMGVFSRVYIEKLN